MSKITGITRGGAERTPTLVTDLNQAKCIGCVDRLSQRIAETSPLAYAICRAMQEEVLRLGLGDVHVGDPASAVYRLSKDPASGQDSLLGEWRDQRGQKQGELIFHADGSFYAEYDVIRTHPRNGSVFVEAVNAWGRGRDIKVEPRLMPMVS